MATLKKVLVEHPADWDTLINKVVFSINAIHQTSTKESAFYLLHGYVPRLPKEALVGSWQSEIPRIAQLNEVWFKRIEAVVNLEEVHNKNAEMYDSRHIAHQFTPGEMVLYDWHQISDKKFTPKFKGPFRVVRKLGEVSYELTDVSNPAKIIKAHISKLKKFKQRETSPIAPN
jgi:hypothetical protein